MDFLQMRVNAAVRARKIHTIRDAVFQPRATEGFVLYLSGACEYHYADVSFVATAGSFLYLPKGQPYHIHPTVSNSSCMLIDFEADAPARRACMRRPEKPERLEALFNAAIRDAERNERHCQPLMLSTLYQLIALVEAPDPPAMNEARHRLRGAERYFSEERCHENVSSAELARLCGVSEKYFRQLFKQAFHMTLGEWRQTMRIRRAKRLLASTDWSVGRIAEHCGYASLYYFSRVFKKETSLSPLEYRRSVSVT